MTTPNEPMAYAAMLDGYVLHLRRTLVGIKAQVERDGLDLDELTQIIPLYAAPDLHFARSTTCSTCQREWTAVFPVETPRVECPSCGAFNDAPTAHAGTQGER